MGSLEGRGPLLRKPLLLRDFGQPDMALPYTRLDFAHLEGRGLHNRALTFAHEHLSTGGLLSAASLFQFKSNLNHIGVDSGIAANVFLPSTLRLTQTWDVRGLIPTSPIRAGASLQATIMSNNSLRNVVHTFGSGDGSLSFMASREELRSGAIILQGQYNFPRQEPRWPEFAVLGHITLPTRDKHPFLETEELSFLALLMASQRFGWLTASMNLGFEWTPEGFEQNNVSYGVGLNAQVHSTLTLTLDLLGRWTPAGDGFFDHMVDLALGARWNPFGAFFLEANLQRSITNSESLRSGITWTIRVNYTF